MAKRRQAIRVRPDQPFKGRQFTAEVILWAVRWYLMFPISYRDLALMLQERGVAVDHTTSFAGSRLMRRNWTSGSARICAGAMARGERMRPIM